ncbi:MAG: non-canonical purine NTP pyrophosphatase, partial [Chloroflexi bacterium]|nr:non-canonical purine NTP pyrophosphatase [Chloroflexota bacterium]
MTTLLIGSGNAGKVAEYRRMLSGLAIRLLAPDDLAPVPAEPEE